jgi:asparagine synthetase B (glutamine-hydrolysing)
MFALAVWTRRRRLLLARDRLGKKPVLLRRRQRVLFASELKALLADPSVPRGRLTAVGQFVARQRHRSTLHLAGTANSCPATCCCDGEGRHAILLGLGSGIRRPSAAHGSEERATWSALAHRAAADDERRHCAS